MIPWQLGSGDLKSQHDHFAQLHAVAFGIRRSRSRRAAAATDTVSVTDVNGFQR
jgi:hypothetical protein